MAEEEEQASGGKSKVLLFAGILVVAIGASVAGTWFFLGSEPESVAEEEVEEGPQIALYYNLRPSFVVNFLAGNKPRYLQAELTVMARDESVIDGVIAHTPLIRASIVDYLASIDFASIQTHEGKEELRADLAALIDEHLVGQDLPSGVTGVLITNFVLQ